MVESICYAVYVKKKWQYSTLKFYWTLTYRPFHSHLGSLSTFANAVAMSTISCHLKKNVSLCESFIPTSEICIGPVGDSRSSVESTLPRASICVGQQLQLAAGNVVSTGFNLYSRLRRGPKYYFFFPGMPKETDGCRCRRTSERRRRRQCGKVGLLILACPVRLTHRGSWRPNSVTTKPNSSPPKRRRNTRWTRWPWSWSWNGPKRWGEQRVGRVWRGAERSLQLFLLSWNHGRESLGASRFDSKIDSWGHDSIRNQIIIFFDSSRFNKTLAKSANCMRHVNFEPVLARAGLTVKFEKTRKHRTFTLSRC